MAGRQEVLLGLPYIQTRRGSPADINKNDFQDKFAGYGIYRFQNLPTNQKEN